MLCVSAILPVKAILEMTYIVSGRTLNPTHSLLVATFSTVTVADSRLTMSSQLKSLGVIFDFRLTFDTHVSSVCKACNYHIWALRHIWRVLPQDVAKTLASSIVSSRLDYCNAVLYGTRNSTTSKLQKVQNCLARAVLQQRKVCHAQPLLKSLHWLPISQRINFNWQPWLSRYSLLHNLNTFIS